MSVMTRASLASRESALSPRAPGQPCVQIPRGERRRRSLLTEDHEIVLNFFTSYGWRRDQARLWGSGTGGNQMRELIETPREKQRRQETEPSGR